MPKFIEHIPFLESIGEFFRVYGLGMPLHPEIMCMKLEDQPDEKLMHMPLYRSNFFRVIHFTSDNLHFHDAENKVQVLKNCLAFSYPGKLESWTRTGRLYGYVMYFTPSYAGIDVTKQNFDEEYPFFNYNSEMVLQLSESEAINLRHQAYQLVREMYSTESDKLELIKKLLHVYLHSIRRIYHQKVNRYSAEIKQNKSVYNRFRKELDDYVQRLIDHQETKMPTVSLLANRLCINANYLNSVIKDLTGKTASAHIQSKLSLEASAFLLHTNMQIAEISYQLGFESTPYFNRFFKKINGITPSQFRKQYS